MERLVSLLGLVVMLGLAWLMSTHKRKISPRVVVGGLGLQFVLAVFLLWTPPGQLFFQQIGKIFEAMLAYSEAGSRFLFAIDPSVGPPGATLLLTFAFRVLPTIVFFSSFMSIMYYVGVMGPIIKGMAWVMAKTLGTSGAESLSTAANVFAGQTEAPLVIRPFLSTLTLSELNAVMVGGFATISGGLMGALVGMGIDAGHLITASVISAPATLLIAKIMLPETGQPKTLGRVNMEIERPGVNIFEAAAIGASDGMKLAINVAAMLIAFLALVALLDGIIGWVGDWFHGTNDKDWTLAMILSYVFYPMAWIMGIEAKDCLACGEMLGKKMVINEFVAYEQLGKLSVGGSPNELSERTQMIMTYALCGFANFASIGIQIGGIGGLAPERRSDLARLGLRAMLGGTLSCNMTACIAGILL